MSATAPRNPSSGKPYSLPPPLIHARCTACWIVLFILLLTTASFFSLNLQWGTFLSLDALRKMGRFASELLSPSTDAEFLGRLAVASAETLAMSALGTLLAAVAGLMLALPASRGHAGDQALARAPTRLVLNVLRSVPELAWAAHTTGVLGRLFAEAIVNTPQGPAYALRVQGVPAGRVFLYATLPAVLPQVLSYSLYRWENNIRAAAVLGVVGAGGLGQMLAFHMGLFQMSETSSVLIAMLLLVVWVDLLSYVARRVLGR